MKKVLLIFAHPDDEIVGLFTFINRKKKRGISFVTFFLTNGVMPREKMWFFKRNSYSSILSQRILEMKKSMTAIGIKNYTYQNIPSRTLKDNIEPSIYRINKLINKHKIDTLFAPAYEGGHQDHDAANFISSKFVNKLSVYEYSEYNFFSNKVNSNHFINLSGKENNIYLDEHEKKEKIEALKIYESEKMNLNYLSFDKECYRSLLKYDYSKPPHSGILFYRRFSWFSWHPRVDTSKPEDLCRIFKRFTN